MRKNCSACQSGEKHPSWVLSGHIQEQRFSLYVPEALVPEVHTSELQSLAYLVCRLLLEKKKESAHSELYQRPNCPHRPPRLKDATAPPAQSRGATITDA